MIDKLNELCMWLSHQKGMMSQDYAKELAKIIVQLRQQADRIAELEKKGKPTAWIRSGDDQLSLVKEKDDGYMVWKPLYTTPQTKPLSDEEIDSIIYSVDWAYDPVLLARAIEERHGIK